MSGLALDLPRDTATGPTPLPAPDRPSVPAHIIPLFDLRMVIGMLGMLLSVIMSAVNLYSTDINGADIKGGMLFGADEQAWSKGIFESAMVIGMTFAPWCVVTFTLRRMALVMTGLMAFAGFLCPFAPNLGIFYFLRGVQGLAGGAVTPPLITVALRYCPPQYRLYGFAAYALSSNFGPKYVPADRRMVERLCRPERHFLERRAVLHSEHGGRRLRPTQRSVAT